MQQVNLYSAEFRPEQIILPYKHIVFAVVALITVLVVVSVYLGISQSNQSKALKTVQANAIVMQEEVASHKAYLATLKPDPALVDENKSLTERIEQGRRLVSEFESLSLSELRDFSPYLIGLARHTKPELWLSNITIESAGHYLRLQGKALEPDAVPRYLQRLSEETAFEGSRFSLFSVKANEQNNKPFEFILESKPSDQKSSSAVAGMSAAANLIKGGQ